MKLTKILLATFGGATLAFAFSACSQNAAVNNAAANTVANQSNTAAVVNSNSTKPANSATSNSTKPAKAVTSDTKTTSASTVAAVCDVTAFVIDKDPKGVNVRATADRDGKPIGVIPFNKEGTLVHIISLSNSGNGWMEIDNAETVTEKNVFSGSGWVSGNLLAITATTRDGSSVKLHPYEGSAVLATIPSDTEIKLFGCEGKRVSVEYKGIVGWLEPDSQCESPSTLCH